MKLGGAALVLCALAACGGDDRSSYVGSDATEDASNADVAEGADTDAADGCMSMRIPPGTTLYYVAIGEPGADDDACDGRAARDEGGGRCPFRSLRAVVDRRLIEGARAVRVELRDGTYHVQGWDGLRVDGAGRDDDERVTLAAYPGERPVLDVPAPDGEGCEDESARGRPACVRQVVLMTGAFTAVEGLVIHNGLGYHVEIRGGHDHVLRCNTIAETVAFARRSDLVKIDGGATGVRVELNDLSAFRSQAIDITGSFDVRVEGNTFHDPIDGDGGAVGVKAGASGIVVRDNVVFDVCPSGEGVVFSLGGTSSAHHDETEARDVAVVANRVTRSPCKVAQLVSCQGCSFVDNDVDDVGAGVLLSGSATGLPACTAGALGCLANRDAIVRGNRFRDLHGGGDALQADIFLWSDAGERGGLDVGRNTYCIGAGGSARFGLDGALVELSTWAAATGDSSDAAASDAPPCVGPSW